MAYRRLTGQGSRTTPATRTPWRIADRTGLADDPSHKDTARFESTPRIRGYTPPTILDLPDHYRTVMRWASLSREWCAKTHTTKKITAGPHAP